MRRRPGVWPAVLLVTFLVVVLVAEAAVYLPPLRNSNTLSVGFDLGASEVRGEATLDTSYAGTFTEAFDWVNESSPVKTVDCYYDAAYGYAYSNAVSAYGVPLLLNGVLHTRGLSIPVDTIDAGQLESVVTNLSAASSVVLVMTSGALPSAVYSNTTDLVMPWLEAGGRMVWIGAAIGFYSAPPNQPLSSPGAVVGPAGVARFLGTTRLSGLSTFTQPTVASSVLNLGNFTYGLPGYGLNVSSLEASGDMVRGNVEEGYTNVALFPFGAGSLLDYSAPMVYGTEEQFAISVANSIPTGLLLPDTQIVSVLSENLGAGASATWVAVGNFTYLGPRSGVWSFCSYTEQTDPGALLGSTSCLTLPAGGIPDVSGSLTGAKPADGGQAPR